MLYLLLYPMAQRFTVLNVLRYPSFRIVAAGLTALVLGLLLGPWFIERMRRLQYGSSNVRDDTPEAHQRKTGTPSMGGALILLALVAATLLFADLRSRLVWSVLLVTIGFGAVGFADDYLKISRRNSKGVPGRKKLAWQALVVLAVYLIFLTDWNFQLEASFPFLTVGTFLDTHVTLPFVPTRRIDWNLGWAYVPFLLLVVVGTSNAVNLTDGLDGLAIGPTIVSSMTFLVLSYVAGAVIGGFSAADFLGVPRVPRAEDLGVLCAAIAGPGVAFLWFNTYPASV